MGHLLGPLPPGALCLGRILCWTHVDQKVLHRACDSPALLVFPSYSMPTYSTSGQRSEPVTWALRIHRGTISTSGPPACSCPANFVMVGCELLQGEKLFSLCRANICIVIARDIAEVGPHRADSLDELLRWAPEVGSR